MHRYRLREVFSDPEFLYDSDPQQEGTLPRYILQDEKERPYYRSKIRQGSSPIERFQSITFATPEEAWESIKDEPHILADTPLYRFTFYPKNGGFTFEYISEKSSVDRVDDLWVALKNTDNEHVTISLIELLRFVVKEV